jgi:hypothetical protein
VGTDFAVLEESGSRWFHLERIEGKLFNTRGNRTVGFRYHSIRGIKSQRWTRKVIVISNRRNFTISTSFSIDITRYARSSAWFSFYAMDAFREKKKRKNVKI